VWWRLIGLALASPARIAMVQAQDVLGLGSEARMNVPGTSGSSWTWRLDALPGADEARQLREITAATGRLGAS
jgi:4-alpha-glucanotransferase